MMPETFLCFGEGSCVKYLKTGGLIPKRCMLRVFFFIIILFTTILPLSTSHVGAMAECP